MSMNPKNQEAMKVANKQVTQKTKAIIANAILPDMSKEAQVELIDYLSERKAERDNLPLKDVVKGQTFYVEDLVRLAGMTLDERVAYEYNRVFMDIASPAEITAFQNELMLEELAMREANS